MEELALLERNVKLTPKQWKNACTTLDTLITKTSNTIQETCNAPPIPPLSKKIAKQGGFLPKNLQKSWKKHTISHKKSYICN